MSLIELNLVEVMFYRSTLCIIAAMFGSFVKTWGVDNIFSIREIFQQMFFAVFMAILVLIYGEMRGISHKWQYGLSLIFGFVGIDATQYLCSKLGQVIISVGKGIMDFGKAVEQYTLKKAAIKKTRNKPKKSNKIIQDILNTSNRIDKKNESTKD